MNRYALFVQDAMSLTLVFVIADQAAHGGQRIVFKEHPACFVQLICFQELDDLRDRGVDGTALLTLGFFTAETAVRFFHYMKCHVRSSIL